MYGPYGHGWMFDGGFGMVIGGLWMILMWAIPLLLIIALLKYLFGSSRAREDQPRMPEAKSPLDILMEAYARGDISRDEFRQKRDDIREK
jgi:putative membrane protein